MSIIFYKKLQLQVLPSGDRVGLVCFLGRDLLLFVLVSSIGTNLVHVSCFLVFHIIVEEFWFVLNP
jgi:hypothetical protein